MTKCAILDAHVLLQHITVVYCIVLDAKHGDRLAARLAHAVQAVLLEKFGAVRASYCACSIVDTLPAGCNIVFDIHAFGDPII